MRNPAVRQIVKIQFSPFIMLRLAAIGMDHFKVNHVKMTIKLSFSYNTFINSMVKKFGSQNMTYIHYYPNLCYNELCYKGTALRGKNLITGPSPRF